MSSKSKFVAREIKETFDVVVVGGGLAGICAAIASARHGCKTALIQDRPVLGGNSSSEIRVPPGGANKGNAWARETGIIEEIVTEDRARNHEHFWSGMVNSIRSTSRSTPSCTTTRRLFPRSGRRPNVSRTTTSKRKCGAVGRRCLKQPATTSVGLSIDSPRFVRSSFASRY